MVKNKQVKIGLDLYEIQNDAEMFGTELGSIEQSTSIIRMRLNGHNNRAISKRMYYKILMHEIAHGIDFNVMFVKEDKVEDHSASEDCIDLVSIYMIEKLERIVEEREAHFDEFSAFIEACESKIVRTALLYYAILDFTDDNKELVQEFIETFK